MKKEKILVKIHGTCNQNPHGEMTVAYIIEYPYKKAEIYHEIIDSRHGNSLNTAEYMALNKALDKLIEQSMTKSDIEIQTTSHMIALHKLGHMKPNKGHYVSEALMAYKKMNRFLKVKVEKVNWKDNLEVINLSKGPDDTK